MASIRKHLVNAFENAGRRRGWDDSLITPYTVRRCGYKSLREFARRMANLYMPENHILMPEPLLEMIEQARREDVPLTQYDFDCFADEEIDAW